MTQTIDMTPTFEQAVNMCIVALENGTPEGKQMAREELQRYGRELDRLAKAAGSSFDLEDTPVQGGRNDQ